MASSNNPSSSSSSSSLSSSSSSLSSETKTLEHPYQQNHLPGPKGAYEIRQVQTHGLYVRVDMPGAPPENLKLRKYSDTRTVTFTATAPAVWPNVESSDRVYGGYVVLDRDPNLIDNINVVLKKGCLRMFFPNSEGSLHCLTSSKTKALSHQVQDYTDNHPIFDNEDSPLYGDYSLRKYEFAYQPPNPDQARGVKGGNFAHINPFLLSGNEGVYEHRVVEGEGGPSDSHIYVRMDMPGVSSSQYTVGNRGKELIYAGNGQKESKFDEGGRTYTSMLFVRCSCCAYVKVKDEMKDGVLRFLAYKFRYKSSCNK